MNSVMIFGAFALAAVFAVCFLWASQLAKHGKEKSEGLQDQVSLEQEQKKQLENALAHAKLEYARQSGQMTALQDSIRQHNAMNQALHATLVEADSQREALHQKLMSEIAHSRQLGDRLARALKAVNDVSQTIIDLAESHRSSVGILLEPAVEQPAPQAGQAAPESAAQPETLPDPEHDRPLALTLGDEIEPLETGAAFA